MTQPEQKKNPEATALPVPPRHDAAPCEPQELGTAELQQVAGGPAIQNGQM